MAMLTRFDITSDFTLFYIGLLALMITIVFALSRATDGGKGKRRSRNQKFDDSIVNRDRELID